MKTTADLRESSSAWTGQALTNAPDLIAVFSNAKEGVGRIGPQPSTNDRQADATSPRRSALLRELAEASVDPNAAIHQGGDVDIWGFHAEE